MFNPMEARRFNLPFSIVLALLVGGSTFSQAEQPSATSASAAPILFVHQLGRGATPLNGPWQFHIGDDSAWASASLDDSHWEQLTADDTWGTQGHAGYTGFAWYRRHIQLAASAGAHESLAVLMPPVDDAYEIYWNGVKIGNQGSLPPHAVWYVGHRQSFAFPVSSPASPEGVLALRVWKGPLNSTDLATGGGLNAPPLIGDSDVIGAIVGNGDFRRLRSSLYGRALSLFFLLAAALSFFAWMRSRGEKLFLWFAVWLVAKVVLFYIDSDRVIELISYEVFSFSLLLIYSVIDCSVFLLLLYLFNLQNDRRLLRWTWTAIAVNVSFGLADGFVGLSWANAGLTMQWLDAGLTAVFQLTELWVLVLVYKGLRGSFDWPRKLVAIMAFLVYLHEAVRIGSIQGRRFTHWTLHDKMTPPLFHIFGAGITTRQILETTLIVCVGYALTRRSIEQRMREQAIELELKSAEAATKAKSSFLANMSHEIRTPMNAIIGMSHLALRTELNPRQKDYLKKIQQSGQHLLGIINDILDFSKIEAGKISVETIDFEFDKVLDNVSNLISEKATAKGAGADLRYRAFNPRPS
jgi:signal transduction histidine kinase